MSETKDLSSSIVRSMYPDLGESDHDRMASELESFLGAVNSHSIVRSCERLRDYVGPVDASEIKKDADVALSRGDLVKMFHLALIGQYLINQEYA